MTLNLISGKYAYLVYLYKSSKISLLMPFTIENLAEIEAHLATHPTLSEGGAPGAVDANIYLALGSKFLVT
jgi:hypothetical protein